MVFQQFNLFPHMTALGNVMEGLRTVRRESSPRRAPREKELTRVGLADKADTGPPICRAARSSGSPSPARSP